MNQFKKLNNLLPNQSLTITTNKIYHVIPVHNLGSYSSSRNARGYSHATQFIPNNSQIIQIFPVSGRELARFKRKESLDIVGTFNSLNTKNQVSITSKDNITFIIDKYVIDNYSLN